MFRPRHSGPPATRREEVVEEIHGTRIVDPYRWLEGEGKEVDRWTAEQNAYTETVLGPLPERAAFRQELERLLNADTVGSVVVRRSRAFYTFRAAGQDQPALWMRDLASGGAARLLVDPGRDDPSGMVSLDWWHASPSGGLVAFGLSRAGDEWSVLQVMRVDTGERLADHIPRTRYASLAWDLDEAGFLYTRYPLPGTVPRGEENYHRHVFHHRLGDDWSDDDLVYGEGQPREEMYELARSEDGAYLVLTVHHGWSRADVYVRREGEEVFSPVAVGKDAVFLPEMAGGRLYLLTNYQAPCYRVVAVDLADPREENWEVIVPERADLVLQEFRLAGETLLVTGLRDAASRLLVCAMDGRASAEVDLGSAGTISGLAGEPGNPLALFRFESYTLPPALYRLELRTRTVDRWLAGTTAPGMEALEVEQLFYRSADGTSIPLFLIGRTRADAPTAQPTILTGYGGFNISLTPLYSPSMYPWLARGGLLAVACLRGGSEYGEAWHRAGMRENKQNVFDDFLAAAEFLIEQGFTDRRRLGILGRSNGGLLTGAALTQRPAMCRAAVVGVPLLDMLRYHRFLIASLWVDEYGSPDDPKAFAWLQAYSPYHRVRPGVEYPAVYLHTAASDTRVHPCHARKMAALLQHATRSDSPDRPVLLRVETLAGHGAGKPVSKVVDEQAETLAFLAWQLGSV
ncbi:MAG TPA: S9 family peptidase [Clostridiales bacterium]|nr:S9 family peptidase [Clostridiales bacterium]